MINENRREPTQVGGVWGENHPQYEESMTQLDDQKEDFEINPLSED